VREAGPPRGAEAAEVDSADLAAENDLDGAAATRTVRRTEGDPSPLAEASEFEIRPFRLADEPEVVDLWVRCELVRPWNDPGRDIRRKLEVQAGGFLVALDEERVVGTVMGGYEGHRGWVNYLAVDPPCRRTGLGRRLMEAVEAQLLGRGCPKVNLQMRMENRLASRFYEAIGYREDHVRSFGKRLIPDDATPGSSHRGAASTGDPGTPAAGVSTTSLVSLREIDEHNVRKVTALAVTPGQRRFVAENAVSLAEALVCKHAWYRAVYADEAPVGFCMIYEDLEKPIYYLWRFMVDARYQGLGFGRQAIGQLIERGQTLSSVREMLLSVVEGEGGPRAFYESVGFVSTGRYDDGELILRLDV
jgi:ribosomal protein S18 acetylase RimI-like enzyme